jgi:hypothetical protein
LYFRGIGGGQLQCWSKGEYRAEDYEIDGEKEPKIRSALFPRVARLSNDIWTFRDNEVLDVKILDTDGTPLRAEDHERRLFEASWVHKYKGT